MNSRSRLASILGTITLLAGVSWMSHAAVSAALESVRKITVTIESVDLNRGEVFLRDVEGQSLRFNVSPDTPELKKMKVGGKLQVIRYQSMALKVTPKRPRAAASSRDESSDAESVMPEINSSMAARNEISTTILVESVNKSSHSIEYKDENGFNRDMAVENPELRKIVDELQPGDQVQVTRIFVSVVDLVEK